MKKTKTTLLTILLVLFIGFASNAQGVIDGFFNKKGDVFLTASYTRSTFDEFYMGEKKVNPVPAHNQINQNIFTLYGTYGLTEDLTIITNIPYISAEGEGVPDPVNGETEQSGFQDISLFAKYRPFRVEAGTGTVDFLGSLGVKIPTGYEPNGLLSIGNGAFSTDAQIGVHFLDGSGFFTTLVGGYSFRGNADDNIGVNGGNDFDVPNAFITTGKIGYAAATFYVEAWVDYQSSSDGVDIGSPQFTGNFPETKVDYSRLGITAYVPLTSVIGISAGYGTVVDGRNLGDSNYFNTGVTFNFNTNNEEEQ